MFTVVGLGARLGDRYVLIDCIGTGGMGEVWSARDEVLDRVVAVKVLAGPLANDPAFRASIRREAMASARLIHPHVTQVFDFGEQSAGSGVVLPYLVMELVEGDNLHDRLREGALPWPQAVEVGADVAEALEAAHRIGVVHLDIKPDNVMLTRAGAKVLDFGIAALAGRQPFAGNGLRVGTPTYSAPERRHGGSADPAADVFSLGVLLYECLVGRPPRRVDSWGDMAVAEAMPVAPVDVPGLPAEVAVVVGRCLHEDSAQRPSSARVAQVLAAAAGRVPRGQVAAQKTQYGIAAVPHRTMIERDPIDAGLLPVERRGPGRLGPLAIVGGAAALIFVAVLVGASLSSGALTGTAAPSTAVISSQAGPPVPSADPTPTDRAAILAAVQNSVDAGVAAGEIDADTGKNLRDSLQQLSKRLEQGKQAKVADGANELLKQIDGWAQDDQIPPQRAAELQALLQPLTVPQDRQA